MSAARDARDLPVGILIRTAIAVAVVPPLLRIASFQKVAARLERGWPKRRPGARDFADQTVADAVDDLLARLPEPWRHTCLKRSAVLFHVLRSARRPVQLVIGVRRDEGGEFTAHAWLLKDGHLYLEREPEVPPRFRVLARFPEASVGA